MKKDGCLKHMENLDVDVFPGLLLSLATARTVSFSTVFYL